MFLGVIIRKKTVRVFAELQAWSRSMASAAGEENPTMIRWAIACRHARETAPPRPADPTSPSISPDPTLPLRPHGGAHACGRGKGGPTCHPLFPPGSTSCPVDQAVHPRDPPRPARPRSFFLSPGVVGTAAISNSEPIK